MLKQLQGIIHGVHMHHNEHLIDYYSLFRGREFRRSRRYKKALGTESKVASSYKTHEIRIAYNFKHTFMN